MAADPPVTIGLPVHNGAVFVADAIRSILAQDHTDFRLLIADNASTDATEEICREFTLRDERVDYVRHDSNLGASRNFNYVMESSSGPLFKWAAHDDVLAPAWLSSCLAALDEQRDAVLAYTRRVVIGPGGDVIRVPQYPTAGYTLAGTTPVERFRSLLSRSPSCTEVFGVIRRRELGSTRLLQAFGASDRVLLAELALRGRFVEIPERLFLHREHGGRSVRTHPDAAAVEWFDPSVKAERSFPTWRLGAEYVRAISRCPLPRSERLKAYGTMVRWGRNRWRRLGANVLDAALALARCESTRATSRPGRRPPTRDSSGRRGATAPRR